MNLLFENQNKSPLFSQCTLTSSGQRRGRTSGFCRLGAVIVIGWEREKDGACRSVEDCDSVSVSAFSLQVSQLVGVTMNFFWVWVHGACIRWYEVIHCCLHRKFRSSRRCCCAAFLLCRSRNCWMTLRRPNIQFVCDCVGVCVCVYVCLCAWVGLCWKQYPKQNPKLLPCLYISDIFLPIVRLSGVSERMGTRWR